MGLFKEIIDTVGGLAEGAAAIKTGFDLFTGGDDVPSEVSQAARDTSAIARALLNPDDPLFQKLAQQEEGIITRDFSRALRELGTANVRQAARTGGLGILNPERRDEALAGAFAKSFADRKQAARDQARAYLSSALTANRAVAGTFAPQIAADQAQREQRASGMQFLLDLFGQQQQGGGINFDVNLRNPPNLSFGTGFGADTSRPLTYTTPGLSFGR